MTAARLAVVCCMVASVAAAASAPRGEAAAAHWFGHALAEERALAETTPAVRYCFLYWRPQT